jgi:hypothetical protein
MTTKQLSAAFAMANSNDFRSNPADLAIFDGFGLKSFQPIVATTAALAVLIRWQCMQLCGDFDLDALNEIRVCLRRKLTIVD